MVGIELFHTSFLVDSSLLAYYRLEGNPNDTLGRSNGSVGTITWPAGKFGQGAKFPGTNNNVITIANTLPTVTSFSICLWVKVENLSQSSKYFCRDFGGGTDWAFHLGQDSSDNKFRFGVHYNVTYNEVSSTTVFTTGTTYFLVGTFDGTNQKIWVNAINENSFGSASAVQNSDSKTIYLGCLNPTTQTTTSLVDDVAFFSKVLTQSEILSLYDSAVKITSEENGLRPRPFAPGLAR